MALVRVLFYTRRIVEMRVAALHQQIQTLAKESAHEEVCAYPDEQVCTQALFRETENLPSIQALATAEPTEKASRLPLVVKGRARVTRRRKKKGGWKSLSGLWWEEVESVFDLRKAAAEAGTPLTHLVSIKPPLSVQGDDKAEKRWCCDKANKIFQAVRGRGKKARQETVPAVTVYEKRPGKFLHAHMLIHVRRGNDALKRLSDGDLVHSRRAVPSDAGYVTKQRLPGSPEFEEWTTHKRQASVKITGVRLSLNSDAKALLATGSKPVSEPTAVALTSAVYAFLGADATLAVQRGAEVQDDVSLEWSTAPVPGWREGVLTFHNLARDETVTVQIRPASHRCYACDGPGLNAYGWTAREPEKAVWYCSRCGPPKPAASMWEAA